MTKHVKIIASAKKDNSWNPSLYICENMKYLKGVADTSVIECDEIVLVMGVLSRKKTNTIATKTTNTIATKMTNTIARNVTSTASINCHSKKGHLYFAHCFISHHITNDNCYYLLSLCYTTKRYNIK